MRSTSRVPRTMAASLLIGCILTGAPLLAFASPMAQFFARPGIWVSELTGASDKWGIPALTPYLLGGSIIWATLTFVVLASVTAVRNKRHTVG